METRDFLHNAFACPFPAKVSTECRGRRAAAATRRSTHFGVVADLAGARSLSCSARGDAHHINAVGINVGDHVVCGVKIIFTLFLKWRRPRRWSPASRTPSHAHLLLPKLQLSLAKGQLALPHCQFRCRRAGPTGGEAVAAIRSIGVIVHHQMAEFLQTF